MGRQLQCVRLKIVFSIVQEVPGSDTKNLCPSVTVIRMHDRAMRSNTQCHQQLMVVTL